MVRAAIKDERWHLLLARVHSCHFTWIASSESISSELPGRLLTSRNLIARYTSVCNILDPVKALLLKAGEKSKHLKGRLGPCVSKVTFLDQRRSVGVPC